MKIGVITWFHYENYGTALQATALQEYLKSINQQPELVDIPIITPQIIKTENNKKLTLKLFFRKVKNKIDNWVIQKLYASKQRERTKKFNDIIYKHFVVSEKIKDYNSFISQVNKYDLLICGSDQIWNPNWCNDYYLANYDKIKTPKISYAPSLGVKRIPDQYKGTYFNALKGFDSLSVREENAQQDIVNTLRLECDVVVDPVLLLNEDDWSKMISSNECNEKYILCYLLSDNVNYWKAIKKFARTKDIKLKIFTMTTQSFAQKGEKIVDAGPKDFLTYIKNAQYVLTDSFHACIFSIIFHKKFYVFERHNPQSASSQNYRIYSLLKKLHLFDRLVQFNSNNILENTDIDYEKVDKILHSHIVHSKKYLEKAIKKVRRKNAKSNTYRGNL